MYYYQYLQYLPISYTINGVLTYRNDGSIAPNHLMYLKDKDADIILDSIITDMNTFVFTYGTKQTTIPESIRPLSTTFGKTIIDLKALNADFSININEFEKTDKLFQDFYLDDIYCTEIHFVYINTSNDIEKIKEVGILAFELEH